MCRFRWSEARHTLPADRILDSSINEFGLMMDVVMVRGNAVLSCRDPDPGFGSLHASVEIPIYRGGHSAGGLVGHKASRVRVASSPTVCGGFRFCQRKPPR
jgi:hypothetical protein